MKQKKHNYLVIVRTANPNMFPSLSLWHLYPKNEGGKTFCITKIAIEQKLTLSTRALFNWFHFVEVSKNGIHVFWTSLSMLHCRLIFISDSESSFQAWKYSVGYSWWCNDLSKTLGLPFWKKILKWAFILISYLSV